MDDDENRNREEASDQDKQLAGRLHRGHGLFPHAAATPGRKRSNEIIRTVAGLSVPVVADVAVTRGFFNEAESDEYLGELLDEHKVAWRHEEILVYGRWQPQPRLTMVQGEPGAIIRYNSRSFEPSPWTPGVLAIKARVEQEFGVTFNTVLMNLYRSGRDSVGYHSDDEATGSHQTIASVSFGATRRFLLKHRTDANEPVREVELRHGDVLIMTGKAQQHWQHSVPKTAALVEQRVNLTFRSVDTIPVAAIPEAAFS